MANQPTFDPNASYQAAPPPAFDPNASYQPATPSAPLTEKDAASGTFANQQAAARSAKTVNDVQDPQDATAVSAGEGAMGTTITGSHEKVQQVRDEVAEGGKRNLEVAGALLGGGAVEAPEVVSWGARLLPRLAQALGVGTGAAVGNTTGQLATKGTADSGEAAKTGAGFAGADLGLGLATDAAVAGASKLADVAKGVKNLASPSEDVAGQALKDSIAKAGNVKDPETVDTLHSFIDKPKWKSTVENELKLVKPKIDTEISKASQELEKLRQTSNGTVTNAKQTIHSYLDDLVAKSEEFGLDKDAVVQGIHNVRDEITPKLNNARSTFKGLNDIKRTVDEHIASWKNLPPVTDTVKKAEQETLRGVRNRIQDLENTAEPKAAPVNTKLSKLYDAAEALEKKFPTLDTAEKTAASYEAGVRDRVKQIGIKVAKAGGILGALGIAGKGLEAIIE